MAPIPPAWSNVDKALWSDYIAGKFKALSPTSEQEQFRADEPTYRDGAIRVRDDRNQPVDGYDQPLKWYELHYGKSNLKFTVDMFGKQSPNGYPVFIMLHGGGGDDTPRKVDNNKNWFDMATHDSTYYGAAVAAAVNQGKPSGVGKLDGAVYIAARGTTVDDSAVPDTWDLHFRPTSFVLFTKLIRQLTRPQPFQKADFDRMKSSGSSTQPGYTLADSPTNFVDPNRVYIMGFSAGGDGVYQLAPTSADQFAAANMSAGHPGDAKFHNLAALPLSLQMGDKDIQYYRSRLMVEKYQVLKKFAKQLGHSQTYVTDCFLHNTTPFVNAGPGNALDDYYHRHNSWEAAEGSRDFGATSKIFHQQDSTTKETVALDAWLQQVKACKIADIPWNAEKEPERSQYSDRFPKTLEYYTKNVTQDSSNLVAKNTNAVLWMASQGYRQPVPPFVIWNLGSRPRRPKGDQADVSAEDFELYNQDSSKIGDEGASPQLVIRADRAGNAIYINQPYKFLGVLLNERMINFRKPVTVYVPAVLPQPMTKEDELPIGSGSIGWSATMFKKLESISVTPVEAIKQQSLQARGDLNYMFSAVL